MESGDDFKSTWISKIRGFKIAREQHYRYNALLRKPDEISVELDSAIGRALKNLRLDPGKTEELLRSVKEDRSYSEVKGVMKDVVAAHKELLDIETQTRRSDIETKKRFLLFRILTAIGIAMVVLATAYVAQKFGIRLPLVRV